MQEVLYVMLMELGGFVANIGVCSVMATELWGIIYGMRLARQKGLRKIIVESDNKSIVELLHKNARGSQRNFQLIHEVVTMTTRLGSGMFDFSILIGKETVAQITWPMLLSIFQLDVTIFIFLEMVCKIL